MTYTKIYFALGTCLMLLILNEGKAVQEEIVPIEELTEVEDWEKRNVEFWIVDEKTSPPKFQWQDYPVQ